MPLLPIAAASVRLDAKALKKRKCTLGAAMLALVLLNGVLLSNDDPEPSIQEINVSDLTDRLQFRSFGSMVDEGVHLS